MKTKHPKLPLKIKFKNNFALAKFQHYYFVNYLKSLNKTNNFLLYNLHSIMAYETNLLLYIYYYYIYIIYLSIIMIIII